MGLTDEQLIAESLRTKLYKMQDNYLTIKSICNDYGIPQTLIDPIQSEFTRQSDRIREEIYRLESGGKRR